MARRSGPEFRRETRLVFARHEDYDGSGLTAGGAERARATGAILAERGIAIGCARSSPQWRCIQTARLLLEGNRSSIPLARVELRLGDLELDPAVDERKKAALRTRARELGIAKELLVLRDEPLRPHLRRRGAEGAAALVELVRERPGETLLAVSHGGSRMEPTICTLLGRDVADPPFVFERGSVALLAFDGLDLLSVDYLGRLG